MMRKLHFLLAALLMQLVGSNVYAQTQMPWVMEYGDPLIQDIAQISSNASDEEEGTNLWNLIDGDVNTFWHSDWHGQVSGLHYLQVELVDAVTSGNIVVYLQRRDADSGHLVNAVLSASADGETWTDLADIVFGKATAKAEVLSQLIPINGTYAFFRLTKKETGFFHTAELQLYNPSDLQLVMGQLSLIISKYEQDYYGGYETLKVGTDFGQYTDTVTADQFLQLYENVLNFANNPDAPEFPTLEGAKGIETKMDSLYGKLHESEVLYRLPADGYYRIRPNLKYRQTVQTGEVDEFGNPITEIVYHDKGMFCSLNYKASWGDMREDRANFLWKLTQTGDSIDMVNAGMEARFTVFTNPVTMSETGDKHVIFDFAGREDGHDIVYIRPATAERNSDKYLHQMNHSRGTQTADQTLTVWYGTYTKGEPYESDKGTSEWYIEPVSEAEALAMIEAFAPIKNHDLLVAQNNSLRKNVANAIVTAKDYIEQPLITSAGQMTSPFSQNDFGDPDGGNLSDGVLIDKNPDTYWHSVWSNGEVATGSHYLQISDIQEMVGNVKIYVRRRNTADNHPVEFTLKASNDPSLDDAEWVTLSVQALGNASSGQEFTTPIFNVGDTPYSYLRIYGSKNTFWHSAELQIYRLLDNPNSQFVALGELATTLESLYEANLATSDDDITPEMVEQLRNAYLSFLGGMVDPTALRAAITEYADADKLYIEGEGPGFWSDNAAVTAYQNLYNTVKAYDQLSQYSEEQNRKYIAALEMAAKSIKPTANKIDTEKWYRIKFPSEAMYDANGWNKSGASATEIVTSIFDNYIYVGDIKRDEEANTTEYWTLNKEQMREGAWMIAKEQEYLTEENGDGTCFRFIPTTSKAKLMTDAADLAAKSRLALDMSSTYSYGEDLITDVSQLSSNASDEAEGQIIGNLIDGDINSFWHTDYHDKATAPHYLQVALTSPVSGAIQVTMTRRQNAGGGDALRMFVTGSTDGNEWTNIGYIEFPFKVTGETLTTSPLNLNGTYSYLRFILTQRRGDTTEYDPFDPEKWTYFHLAEFQVRTVNATEELTSAHALKAAYADFNKIVRKDVTAADYAKLYTAYKAIQTEINSGGTPVAADAEEVPGSSYAMQNKATGLFIYTADKNSNDVTLRTVPTLFSYTPMGYGACLIHGFNIDGKDCTNLHVQLRDHRFCTWESTNLASNSMLMLEGAGPVEDTELTFAKNVMLNGINTMCPAVSLNNYSDGLTYSVEGVFKEGEETYLALKETEVIAAGQPTIFIVGNPSEWVDPTEEAPADTIPAVFGIASTDFNFVPGAHNGLHGTLYPTKVDSSYSYFISDSVFTVMAKEGATIRYDRAYLNLKECPEISADSEYDLSILITGAWDDATPVTRVVEKVSKSGNIYTLDGRLVRKSGTIADMKRLGRGIYILNGVKVFVK